MTNKMNHRLHIRDLLVMVAVAAGATMTVTAQGKQQPSPPATLQDLRTVEELKTAFNRDSGKVRLVLLLSPT